MTFISRKTRLLMPHFLDECDPGYLYHLNKKRSDGRLKRHSSCDDLRAWVDNEYLNYQYLLELMTDGEFQERPFLGLMGRFIPVDAILNILCHNASEGGDSFVDWEKGGGRMAGLQPKGGRMNLFDSTVSTATENLLKLADAAMSKLETIRCILCTGNRNAVSREDGSGMGRQMSLSNECMNQSSTSAVNNSDMEEYAAEYNSTLTKIACLKQRLNSIQECRDELNAKIQSSNLAKRELSSGMAVTELYNREEESNAKCLQKKIEKLIEEKGEVLREMCMSLKYLNELRKNVNTGSKQNACPCACPKIAPSSKCGYTPPEGDFIDFFFEKHTDLSASTSKFGFQDSKVTCRKCTQYTMKEPLPDRESNAGSSEATFMSTETLPVCDSQRTYNIPIVRESVPDRKFKSETSMTELEQTLRSYEQRLSELNFLETEIEELKKKATLAEYFKKRWLRSMMRGRSHKAAEDELKREMQELYEENCELKKLMQKIASDSERDHDEMERLRCKAKKLIDMQEEMRKLRKEIGTYQLSCESQNECIARLENTIREQRDEINKLLTHLTRLCRMTEKLREGNKPIRKDFPRSRSYGPERQNSAPVNPPSAITPDEETQHAPCCGCNRHNCTPDALNRPQSECGRRMPGRCCETVTHHHTCRSQFRYN